MHWQWAMQAESAGGGPAHAGANGQPACGCEVIHPAFLCNEDSIAVVLAQWSASACRAAIAELGVPQSSVLVVHAGAALLCAAGLTRLSGLQMLHVTEQCLPGEASIHTSKLP
jgi:hypothetical protein